LGPSPLGHATIFYCLTLETSLFVASYDSQGHGGGIRPRLHTGSVSLLITDSLINPQSDNGTRASFPCCVVTVFTDCLATLPELFIAP
jgi:hypothetical protein